MMTVPGMIQKLEVGDTLCSLSIIRVTGWCVHIHIRIHRVVPSLPPSARSQPASASQLYRARHERSIFSQPR